MATNHEEVELLEKDFREFPEEGMTFSSLVFLLVVAVLATFVIHWFNRPDVVSKGLVDCHVDGYSCRLEDDSILIVDPNGGRARVHLVWAEK